jgi:hypothetical protein
MNMKVIYCYMTTSNQLLTVMDLRLRYVSMNLSDSCYGYMEEYAWLNFIQTSHSSGGIEENSKI